MEQNELVYSGILLLPPAGKILLKKTWQQKQCLLYKASKFGIERLEVYDSQDVAKATPSRIITLENCIKITSSSPTHFTVTTKSAPGIYEFGALSPEVKNEWMSHLQSVAFPDDVSLMTSVQEDNDLYCSSGEGIFHVRIFWSPASDRCGLDTKTLYTLLLTQTAMQLRNLNDCNLLYTWPYRYIRRYGYKGGKFTFEAGRMCDSGEGTFFLLHSNQQEIFRCLASKMKTMKKMLKEDSSTPPSSSTVLDFGAGENQFHAAMSMEARSRSPLPPSPTTLRDVEASISNSALFEDVSSASSSSFSSSKVASIKQKLAQSAKPQKPNKPPRKNLVKPQPPPPLQQSDQNKLFTDDSSANAYEPIDKYDRVEYRSDAWRTMGVNEIKHTENVGEEDEEYMSWGFKPASGKFVPPASRTPKILTNPPITPEEDPNYDKLNFFGSSRQLNVKSGYKQIAMGASAVPCPPSFNDYDEVQPGIEGIRLADDSHLGYALIRKEPAKESGSPKAATQDPVSHQFHNDEPYAMISKPKRV